MDGDGRVRSSQYGITFGYAADCEQRSGNASHPSGIVRSGGRSVSDHRRPRAGDPRLGGLGLSHRLEFVGPHRKRDVFDLLRRGRHPRDLHTTCLESARSSGNIRLAHSSRAGGGHIRHCRANARRQRDVKQFCVGFPDGRRPGNRPPVVSSDYRSIPVRTQLFLQRHDLHRQLQPVSRRQYFVRHDRIGHA